MAISADSVRMELLSEFLTSLRWSCTLDGAVLTATPPSGAAPIRFALEGGDADCDVIVIDDARRLGKNENRASDGYASLDGLASGSRKTSPAAQRMRLGRDIIFPAVFVQHSPLLRYAENIAASYGFEGRPPELDAEDSIFLADKATETLVVCPISEIATRAHQGESALIAVFGKLGGETLFYQHLFRRHIAALLGDDRNELPTRIPLYIHCGEARAVGLTRALWEAAWTATRAALSQANVARLLQLGYFHVYAPDLERLREGQDLDPNNEFMAAILANGSITLGCDREFVFHTPMLSGPAPKKRSKKTKAAIDPRRALGERFYEPEHLKLYDTGEIGPSETLDRDCEKALEHLARLIAIRSESRISLNESKRLLTDLAFSQHESAAGVISNVDIGEHLRARLTGDRLRPANVRLTTAAIARSDALRSLRTDAYGFRSRLLMHWAMARALCDALEDLTRNNDSSALHRTLNRPLLPLWVVGWALEMFGNLDTTYTEALAGYMQRMRFRDGAPPGDARLTANLWTLILATVRSIDASGERSARSALGRLSGASARLNSVALPQACFSNLTLATWVFNDCNLSHALFRNCDLSGISFQDCSLAGARFEECTFSRTDFSGADVSGAFFDRCEGLGKAIASGAAKVAHSNWSVSDILLDSEDQTDLDAAAQALRTQGASAPAFRIRSPGGAAEVPWPANAQSAFLYGHWDERPVLIMTPMRPNGAFVRVVNLGETLREGFGAFEIERDWIAARSFGDTPESQRILAVDRAGHLWFISTRGGLAKAVQIEGVENARDFSAVEIGGASGSPALRVALMPVGGVMNIQVVDIDGAGKSQLNASPLRLDHQPQSMRWIDPARAGDPSYELLVGFATGAITATDKGAGWEVQPLDGIGGASIDAFGFSPRENVVLACGANGEVFGFRHVGPGLIEPLLRFHTALARILDVVLLNHSGQMLIVGLTAGELFAKPGNRRLLWVLTGASGNVISVVDYNPAYLPPLGPRSEVDLREQRDNPDRRTLDPARQSHIESVSRTLMAMHQERGSILLTPRLTRNVDFTLTDGRTNAEARAPLPESIDNEYGARFRTIELVIESEVEGATSKRTYTESELASVSTQAGKLRVVATPTFKPGTTNAKAELSVFYPSETFEGRLYRKWDYDLQIEWDDNPFVDGAPVVGEQFFGMADEIGEITRALLANPIEQCIVNSARRSGKSSLVQQIAERLRRDETPGRVAVVISGNDVVEKKRGIEREVLAALREIGERTGQREYIELGRMDARGDNIVEALAPLADAARRRGFRAPFTLFVDEWGSIAKTTAGKNLANAAARLRTAGIALCLTSVPGDFPGAEGADQSGDYRFFTRHWDVGRLSDDAIKDLVRVPLDRRNFSIGDDELDAIVRLSSNAPHDANILMHYAFKAAKAELSGEGERRVRMHHILPAKGAPETESIMRLMKKYEDLQRFLIDQLTPSQRKLLLSMAGTDIRPTAENPMPTNNAEWDRTQLAIPRTGMSVHPERVLYADAGYRAPLEEGGNDLGLDPGTFAHRLWIPWGMAEYYRRYGGR